MSGVDLDGGVAEFPSKVNRIGIEGGFGGVVGEGLGVVDGGVGVRVQGERGEDAGEVDDAACGALANEGQERVGEGYDGEEVGFEDGVEDILRDLAGRDGGTAAGETAFGEAGVVDEDVEASVAGVEVVVGGLVIGGLGDVKLEGGGVDAQLAELCGRGFAQMEVA